MASVGNEVQNQIYEGMFSPEQKRLPVSFEDWEKAANNLLAKHSFDYVAGGAGSEETVHNNRDAFKRWQIVPRMLNDVGSRDLRVHLLGHTFPHPFMLAPIGLQSIIHPDGEVAVAKAAAKMGVPMIVSTVSSKPMEEISAAADGSPKWYQLYWNEDPEITASFLKRAERAGYTAIVITLDAPVTPWKERDLTNSYLPFMLGEGIGNYLTDPVFCKKLGCDPESDMKTTIDYWGQIFGNPKVTWDNLSFIREHTNLPILLKGILHPNDAKLALEYGVDGIIVSNHGGRQVDGSVAALDALPEIVAAVQNKVPILMDSGIRRGADVLKALALGATSVLIGRPYIYGLAVAGEEGVEQVLRQLAADIDLTLALCGKNSLSSIDRSLLRRK
ncbi:lactate 2-monooxygenase [Virgibacillus alimentarius]|uniref:L-lactate oxidase n=1 Tax=Virgibacillus alimentarius TaxID=698769 RepID=A0ABS4SC61_9BACI|nr:lactate 2-monooxygenase [Virgibacillus alimentarius]MBP2259101.1 isopentenyl diphosphate isomerase/L-lactate dehydrogenase-like FMN-dependent dehydrogenase [Virgibacillus alimentarius]